MDIVVALIGIAMAVLVGIYLAQPFVARTRIRVAEESPREKLLAERDTIYTAIRDLDFDFQTGKLLQVDYDAMREKYAARGVEILRELDATPGAGGRRSEVGEQKANASDEIEAAVQARRRTRQAAGSQVLDAEIEAAIRARRQAPIRNQKSEIKNQTCPKCGRPVDAADRFCGKCGAALAAEVTR